MNKDDRDIVYKALERIEIIVKENHRALRGSNGKPGLVADVRVLQKEAKTRIWFTRALFVAVIAIAGDVILRFA